MEKTDGFFILFLEVLQLNQLCKDLNGRHGPAARPCLKWIKHDCNQRPPELGFCLSARSSRRQQFNGLVFNAQHVPTNFKTKHETFPGLGHGGGCCEDWLCPWNLGGGCGFQEFHRHVGHHNANWPYRNDAEMIQIHKISQMISTICFHNSPHNLLCQVGVLIRSCGPSLPPHVWHSSRASVRAALLQRTRSISQARRFVLQISGKAMVSPPVPPVPGLRW